MSNVNQSRKTAFVAYFNLQQKPRKSQQDVGERILLVCWTVLMIKDIKAHSEKAIVASIFDYICQTSLSFGDKKGKNNGKGNYTRMKETLNQLLN